MPQIAIKKQMQEENARAHAADPDLGVEAAGDNDEEKDGPMHEERS